MDNGALTNAKQCSSILLAFFVLSKSSGVASPKIGGGQNV